MAAQGGGTHELRGGRQLGRPFSSRVGFGQSRYRLSPWVGSSATIATFSTPSSVVKGSRGGSKIEVARQWGVGLRESKMSEAKQKQ